jgi:2'-5' RNA ligase
VKFKQKYTIVQLIDPLPDAAEWGVENWPLHITIADIFAIDGDSTDILKALKNIKINKVIEAKVVGDAFWGPEKNVHVKLVENTADLYNLHKQIIESLQSLNVDFNSPGFVIEGFKPHSTVQDKKSLEDRQLVRFNCLTLIDMFPDENGYKRRIIGHHTLVG